VLGAPTAPCFRKRAAARLAGGGRAGGAERSIRTKAVGASPGGKNAHGASIRAGARLRALRCRIAT
jgi:hypothetical protein